jgi:nonsense-mediated mRNA decay protein 3
VSKDSVVCLPHKLTQQLGGISPLCLVHRVTNCIHLIDPATAQSKSLVIANDNERENYIFTSKQSVLSHSVKGLKPVLFCTS